VVSAVWMLWMTGVNVGLCHNSVARENTGHMGDRYERQHLVHPGDKLWSLETAVLSRWSTHTGETLHECHDTAGYYSDVCLLQCLCNNNNTIMYQQIHVKLSVCSVVEFMFGACFYWCISCSVIISYLLTAVFDARLMCFNKSFIHSLIRQK